MGGRQRVQRELPLKESGRTHLRQWAEVRSGAPSQAGVGPILRSRAQMKQLNFRYVIALSIYSELTDGGSAFDALNWVKLARWTQTAALAANASKRRPSAPLFPTTLRPGKLIATTTCKVRCWNIASGCWERMRPLPRESKVRSLRQESEAQLLPWKSKAW